MHESWRSERTLRYIIETDPAEARVRVAAHVYGVSVVEVIYRKVGGIMSGRIVKLDVATSVGNVGIMFLEQLDEVPAWLEGILGRALSTL